MYNQALPVSWIKSLHSKSWGIFEQSVVPCTKPCLKKLVPLLWPHLVMLLDVPWCHKKVPPSFTHPRCMALARPWRPSRCTAAFIECHRSRLTDAGVWAVLFFQFVHDRFPRFQTCSASVASWFFPFGREKTTGQTTSPLKQDWQSNL